MRINFTGVVVFAGFCFLFWAALSNSAWTSVAEGIASALILIGCAGMFIPKLKKMRGGLWQRRLLSQAPHYLPPHLIQVDSDQSG